MAWTEYQQRFFYPAYLERDRATPLELEVYSGASLSAPSSGTISIYDASNAAIVSAAAVTVAGSKATYTLPAATVADKSFGSGWRVEWSLVMGDTNTHVFRQDAALVRVRLHPVVSHADLVARHSDIASYFPSGTTSWEAWIIEAWREIVGRLEAMGRRPYLIVSPEALRPVHLYLALEIVFRDLAATGDAANRWLTLADHYRARAEEEWGRLNFVYDETDAGTGSSARRAAGPSSLWLAQSPTSWPIAPGRSS